MTTITQVITALPTAPDPVTMTRDQFSAAAAASVLAQKAMTPEINTWATQANIVAGEVSTNATTAATQAGIATTKASEASTSATQSAASAATAGALVTASDWVSGSTYAVGNIRVSPSNRRLYKCILAAVGRTTDPSTDTAYWLPALFDGNVGDAKFAAISTSLPSLSVVASCFHLAKNDTVKWRKKKGQSWRIGPISAGKYLGIYASATLAVAAGGVTTDVFYNTTTSAFHEITGPTTSTVTYRAGKEDYPANALLTLEYGRFIVWDLDGAVPSMWSVWLGNISQTLFGYSTFGGTSITAANNIVAIGTDGFGVSVVNFTGDTRKVYHLAATANTGTWSKAIAYGRATAMSSMGDNTTIVNATVNSVALAIMPDAPLDTYGMPITTKIVGTAAGGSQIGSNEVVWDATGAINIVSCDITSEGVSAYASTSKVYIFNTLLTADTALTSASYILDTAGTTEPHIHGTIDTVKWVDNTLLIGTSTGLFAFVYNRATGANSLLNVTTSTYTTGLMSGGTVRAIGYDSASALADKSVKAVAPTEVGTLTKTPVSGGRTVVSGFSAANYLQEANHADWNAIGTGDFSILFGGVKWGTAGAARKMIALGDLTAAGHFSLQISAGNQLIAHVHDGASVRTFCAASTLAYTDTAEHVVEFKRIGTSTYILLDGAVVSTTTGGYATTSISNATAALVVGTDSAQVSPWTGGQFSGYVRISTTAPTTEQSKLIAAQGNNLNYSMTCLLSNSDSVSALTYNTDTNSYEVGNGTNVDTFCGLKRLASQAHGVTTLTSLASADGYKLIAGTGATFSAIEKNVKSELDDVEVLPRTQQYLFTTPAATTTQALPKGWKAQGIAFNTTDSTFLGTYTQSFDGFIWTMAGLTASKAYQINLVGA